MVKSTLKEKIIRRIEQIDNKSYLEEVYNFLEAKEPQEVYKLSKDQIRALVEYVRSLKR